MEKDAIASTNAPVKSTIERVPSPAAMAQSRQIGNRSRSRKCARPVFSSTVTMARLADISFVSLGPAAGNVLDNVNRWLGQLAEPPITADKLASTDPKTAHPAR